MRNANANETRFAVLIDAKTSRINISRRYLIRSPTTSLRTKNLRDWTKPTLGPLKHILLDIILPVQQYATPPQKRLRFRDDYRRHGHFYSGQVKLLLVSTDSDFTRRPRACANRMIVVGWRTQDPKLSSPPANPLKYLDILATTSQTAPRNQTP
jgi:hypothetical protein